jgi:SAM-dependent methyltransferase
MDDKIELEMRKLVAAANLKAYDAVKSKHYVDGAPHIMHLVLRQLYADLLVGVFQQAKKKTVVPRVLDLGAGEGSVTLPLLELGAHVTAVDISPDQLAILSSKCLRFSDRLVVKCEDINDALRDQSSRFDIIVANSFLHHIPDYLGMIRSVIPNLAEGGQFFSFQDPLFYSDQSRFARLYDKTAYLAWRVGRGDFFNGLRRRFRRARGIYLQNVEHDNAEYHVLRAGVDHNALKEYFEGAGFVCHVIPYFSTQSAALQCIGDRLRVQNTFALIALSPPDRK